MPTSSDWLIKDECPIFSDPDIAREFGLNEAIILQQFHYWTPKSRICVDGRRWVHRSANDLSKELYIYSPRQVRCAIGKLLDCGVLLQAHTDIHPRTTGNLYSIEYCWAEWLLLRLDTVESYRHDACAVIGCDYDYLFNYAAPPKGPNFYSNARLTRQQLGIVYNKTKGHCSYCHCNLDPFGAWEIDHIIPRCQGGTNDIDNLTPSCTECNLKKNGRTPEQWREANENG